MLLSRCDKNPTKGKRISKSVRHLEQFNIGCLISRTVLQY